MSGKHVRVLTNSHKSFSTPLRITALAVVHLGLACQAVRQSVSQFLSVFYWRSAKQECNDNQTQNNRSPYKWYSYPHTLTTISSCDTSPFIRVHEYVWCCRPAISSAIFPVIPQSLNSFVPTIIVFMTNHFCAIYFSLFNVIVHTTLASTLTDILLLRYTYVCECVSVRVFSDVCRRKLSVRACVRTSSSKTTRNFILVLLTSWPSAVVAWPVTSNGFPFNFVLCYMSGHSFSRSFSTGYTSVEIGVLRVKGQYVSCQNIIRVTFQLQLFVTSQPASFASAIEGWMMDSE